MQRNRRKFNRTSGHPQKFPQGNILTLEQRILVDKQQEMLRNMSSTNQGVSPFSLQTQSQALPFNQIQTLLPSLGNVLPAVSLLPSLFAAQNLIPAATSLVSSSNVLSSPLGTSSSGVRPSLLGPGPPGNLMYDNGGNQSGSYNLKGAAANNYRKKAFNKRKGGNWGEDRRQYSGQESNIERCPSGSADRSDGPQDRRGGHQSWDNRVAGAERSWEFERGKRPRESEEGVFTSKTWDNAYPARSSQASSNLSAQRGNDEYSSFEDSERNQDSSIGYKGQMNSEGASPFKERWRNNEGAFDERDNWENRQKSDDEIDDDDRDDDPRSNYNQDPYEENRPKRQKACDDDWGSDQRERETFRADKAFDEESGGWTGGGMSDIDRAQSSSATNWPNKGAENVSSPNNSGYAVGSRSNSEKQWRGTGQSRRGEYLRNDADNVSSMLPTDAKDESLQSHDGTGDLENLDRKDKFNRHTKGSRAGSNINRKNQSLSDKEFWRRGRKNQSHDIKPLMASSNFLYPNPGNGSSSDIWSRLDSLDNASEGQIGLREERGFVEDILLTPENVFGWDDGWEGLKSLPMSTLLNNANLQLQMGHLDSQLKHLDRRMFSIDNLAGTCNPNQMALSQVGGIWENQSGQEPHTDLLNEGANSGDLRVLLRNKSKTASKQESADADLGGWGENMVVIYPFLRVTRLSHGDIVELRDLLSERIHQLLTEKREDIQPRFFGTGNVCKNWFMIDCADERSADWLLTWKPRLKTRSRMNLCIRKATDAARVTRISIFLKGVKESVRDIELRLTHQNQHLEPRMWRRGPHGTSPNGVTVSFYVDAACVRLLEANSWQVYYELTRFKVSLLERKPVIPLVYSKNK